MEVHKPLLIEELVDGEGHGVTDAEDGPEGVGPEAHMGNASEELKGGVLLLERETHRVAFSKHFNCLCLDLHGLAASLGLYKVSLYGKGRSGGDSLYEFFVEEFRVCYYLDVIDGGTVVEGDEFYLFVSSLGPDPSFGQNFYPRLHLKQSLDFGSF